MLSVTYLPDQALKCHPVTPMATVCPSYRSIGPSPSNQVYFGLFILSLTPDYQAPAVVTDQYPFGWMVQDDRQWGRLRDKGVRHLSANGDVVDSSDISFASGSPDPPSHTTTPPQPIRMCRHIVIAGNSYHVYETIVWGRDFTSVRNIELLSIWNGSVWYDPILLPVRTVRARFSGDYCVIEDFHSKAQFRKRGTTTITTSYGIASCRFYRINRGTSTVLQQTQNVSVYVGGIYPDSAQYTMPNGTRVTPLEVVPDPSLYGTFTWSNCGSVDYHEGEGNDQLSPYWDIKEALDEETGDLLSRVWNQFESVRESEAFDSGDLTADAIRAQSYVDANLLLTVFDLVTLNAQIGDWGNLLKFFSKNTRKLARQGIHTFSDFVRWVNTLSPQACSAYLGISYGVLPTVRDGKALWEGFGNVASRYAIPTRSQARRTVEVDAGSWGQVTNVHVLTLEHSSLPDDALGSGMRAIRLLKRWGMYPSYEMLLDAIPFSFVVGWFNNTLKHLAESSDVIVDKEYFPIEYCVESVRRSVVPPLEVVFPGIDLSQVSGSIEFVYYDRFCSHDLPTPALFPGEGEPSTGSIHYLEGLSLVVQRLR